MKIFQLDPIDLGLTQTQCYWVLSAGPNAKKKEINPTQSQMKKNYHHSTFVQYKKSHQFIYFLSYEKKREKIYKDKKIKLKISGFD